MHERPWNLAKWCWLYSDVPIKHEQPSQSISQLSSQSPTLKRRFSERPDEMGEKRQRVDSGPTHRGIPDYDTTKVVAQAVAAAHQDIGEIMDPTQEDNEYDPDEEEDHVEPPVFISEPHLSMRILSMPVLESLVSSS